MSFAVLFIVSPMVRFSSDHILCRRGLGNCPCDSPWGDSWPTPWPNNRSGATRETIILSAKLTILPNTTGSFGRISCLLKSSAYDCTQGVAPTKMASTVMVSTPELCTLLNTPRARDVRSNRKASCNNLRSELAFTGDSVMTLSYVLRCA